MIYSCDIITYMIFQKGSFPFSAAVIKITTDGIVLVNSIIFMNKAKIPARSQCRLTHIAIGTTPACDTTANAIIVAIIVAKFVIFLLPCYCCKSSIYLCDKMWLELIIESGYDVSSSIFIKLVSAILHGLFPAFVFVRPAAPRQLYGIITLVEIFFRLEAVRALRFLLIALDLHLFAVIATKPASCALAFLFIIVIWFSGRCGYR